MRAATIVIFLALSSQILQSQVWPKYYGDPVRYDKSYGIIETYDQGYIMLGHFSDESLLPVSSWIIKTDINGNILWEKVIENSEYNKSFGIDETIDGGYIICGLIRRSGNSYSEPYVLKINQCGEKEWCRIYSGAQNDLPWAQDIKETPTGEIVVLVNMFGEYPDETLHLFKLDADGNLLWQEPYCSGFVYDEAAIPLGNSLTLTSQSKYIISGDVYWEDPWNPGGPKGIRSLFVMCDSTGNEEWVLPFGLQDSIYGQGKRVLELADKNYLGIANRWPTESMKSVFIEIDTLGNPMNYLIMNAEMIDSSFSKGVPLYLELVDSMLVLGGIYGVPDTRYTTEVLFDTNIFNNPLVLNHFYHLNGEDPYTISLTKDLKILSNSTFKETGNWDISLSKLNLQLEYDTAYPGNYTYDSLCPTQITSGFINLDDCIIVGAEDMPTPQEYYASIQQIPVTAYPNPAKDRITFGFENTKHHSNIQLQCFNLLGKKVHEERIFTGQEETQVNLAGWPEGMYVAVVVSDGKVVGKVKFVVL